MSESSSLPKPTINIYAFKHGRPIAPKKSIPLLSLLERHDRYAERRRQVPPWTRRRDVWVVLIGLTSAFAYFYMYGFVWSYASTLGATPEELGFDRAGALSKAAFFGAILVSLVTLLAAEFIALIAWMWKLASRGKTGKALLSRRLASFPALKGFIEALSVAMVLSIAVFGTHLLFQWFSGSVIQVHWDLLVGFLICLGVLTMISVRRHLWAALLAGMILLLISTTGASQAGDNSALAVLKGCTTPARTNLALLGLPSDESTIRVPEFSKDPVSDVVFLGSHDATLVVTDGARIVRITASGVSLTSRIDPTVIKKSQAYTC